MRVAFPTVSWPTADQNIPQKNWNFSIDTNLEIKPTFPGQIPTPHGTIPREVAAASITVANALLIDVQNWIYGRKYFPAKQALALSTMGRLVQTAINDWNIAINGTCPTQDAFDSAMM